MGRESRLYMMPGANEERDRELEERKICKAYARFGNEPCSTLSLQDLRVCAVHVIRNTISKASGKFGILLQNVKASSHSMEGETMPETENQAKETLERCIGNLDKVQVSENYVADVA